MDNVEFLTSLLDAYSGPLPMTLAATIAAGKARYLDIFGGYDVWVFGDPPAQRTPLDRLDLRQAQGRNRFNRAFKLLRP